MEENQSQRNSLESKYQIYKIIVAVFIAVLTALFTILLFVPTMELNSANSELVIEDILNNLTDAQKESLQAYLKKSPLTISDLNAYASQIDGRSISFFDFLKLSFSNEIRTVLSKDGSGSFSIVFGAIINGVTIVMVLSLLVILIGNLILVLNKKNTNKALSSYSKWYDFLNFFTIRNCVILTIVCLIPFILEILMALSRLPDIFVDNYYSSQMLLSLKYLPVSFVLPVISCLLMYTFTIILSKLNPLR